MTSVQTPPDAVQPIPVLKIPLTVYVHIPWCVKKCPYCDFNSHTLTSTCPETAYVKQLERDLSAAQAEAQGRSIAAVFIGGGTPSLFSATAIADICSAIQRIYRCVPDMEVTLEANPGTLEQAKFQAFRNAGVTRLSLGVQSFHDVQLRALGRIHSSAQAKQAIEGALQAGFDRLNLDLMYGLPQQTKADALADLNQALSYPITHLSWYELTLEPNTAFYHRPPERPDEDVRAAMWVAGRAMLAQQGMQAYEVSAYAHPGHACRHNLNYWQYGDYIGVGAGAHGKITDLDSGEVTRYWKPKHPKAYLAANPPFAAEQTVSTQAERCFEYMLGATRLVQPLSLSHCQARTGLPATYVTPLLAQAQQQGWLSQQDHDTWHITDLGQRYLNDLQTLFLP